MGKSFLALSERADRGVGWAAAPSSTVSSKVITLPESSASWLSIRAAYGTGTGPLRLEPRVTAPGVEIRHHGGRKVNPLPTAVLLFWRSCRVHHGKGDELLFPSICLARHPDSFSRFAANGSSSCRGALASQFECEVRLPNPNTTMGCEAWADSPRTVHGFAPRHLRSQLRWPASIRAQHPCATTTIANKRDSAPTFRSHVLRSSTGARRALCNCPIGYWIHLARRFLQD